MYVPLPFQEDRVPVLHEAMQRIGLGSLITSGANGLTASHVPMLLDPEPAPFGTLRGHIARSNPQWRHVAPNVDALALFLGPHAYVSPSAYATETGKVVPTWNYVAVHAYGKPAFFEDRHRLLAIVAELTARHEGGRPEPWSVGDAPADYVETMLQGIIGFTLPIDRLEGAWKLSQNRSEADRTGVIRGLRNDDDADAKAVAAIMESLEEP